MGFVNGLKRLIPRRKPMPEEPDFGLEETPAEATPVPEAAPEPPVAPEIPVAPVEDPPPKMYGAQMREYRAAMEKFHKQYQAFVAEFGAWKTAVEAKLNQPPPAATVDGVEVIRMAGAENARLKIFIGPDGDGGLDHGFKVVK